MPGRRAASANGYRLTTTRSNGAMPAARSASRWSARRRSARIPPWTRGWSVLTRPSSISGKPVTAATSVTGQPGLAQRARRAPGRDQLPATGHEAAPEVRQPRLVAHREQGAPRDGHRGIGDGGVEPRPPGAAGPRQRTGQQRGHGRRQQPVLDRVDPRRAASPRCRRAGPARPPGPRSARRRASRPRGGPSRRSRPRRPRARRGPRGAPGTTAAATGGR